MWRTLWILPIALALLCSCVSERQSEPQGNGGSKMATKLAMKVTSDAFRDGEMMPTQYGCDGDGISPPLSWDAVPDGVRSFALILHDPDSPSGNFVHWVMWNVPADTRQLQENIPAVNTLKNGAIQGTNSAREVGYTPPCPPSGTHRYVFDVYALNTELELPVGSDRRHLENAMQGHVLAEGRITGRYARQR